MSDSSEEEDLSRFKEAVDSSFTKLIHDAKKTSLNENVTETKDTAKPKSERYLDVASHYNDVKVPEQLQKQIGAKISALINKNIEFVDVKTPEKKHKIKGGVKLFKDSPAYLTSEAVPDTYTKGHNKESKRINRKRRKIDPDEVELEENEKINAAAVTGDYIISKEETKSWKSKRKEKVFKYKAQSKKCKLLISMD